MQKFKIGTGLTIIAVLASVLAFLEIGIDTQVPAQWDAEGNVTAYRSPLLAFSVIPAVQLVLMFVLSKLHVFEPRADNLEKSWKAVLGIMTAVFAFLTAVHFMIIGSAAKLFDQSPTIIFVMIGLMFAVIGNYSNKLHSTFFVGIRTPWTLSSETVWRKTHRAAAKPFVLGGILTAILPFILDEETMAVTSTFLLSGVALYPVAYSWLAWRREQQDT